MKFISTTNKIGNAIIDEIQVDNNIRVKTTKIDNISIEDVYVNGCGRSCSSTKMTNNDTGSVDIVRQTTDISSNSIKTVEMHNNKNIDGGKRTGTIQIGSCEPVNVEIENHFGHLSRHDPIPNVRTFVPVLFDVPSNNNINIDANRDENASKINISYDVKLSSGSLSSKVTLHQPEYIGEYILESLETEFLAKDKLSHRSANISYDTNTTGQCDFTLITDNETVLNGKIRRHNDGLLSTALSSTAEYKIYTAYTNNMYMMSVQTITPENTDEFTLIYNQNSAVIAERFYDGSDNLPQLLMDAKKIIQFLRYDELTEIKYLDNELDHKKLHALLCFGPEITMYNVPGNVESARTRIENATDIEYHLENYDVLGGNTSRAKFIQDAPYICEYNAVFNNCTSNTAISKETLQVYASRIVTMLLSDLIGFRTMLAHRENIKFALKTLRN